MGVKESEDLAGQVVEAAQEPPASSPLGAAGRVPVSFDANGTLSEQPKWSALLALPAYAVVMVVLGAYVALGGSIIIGLVLALVGLVPSVGIVAYAHTRLPQLLGRDALTCEAPELGLVLGGGEEALRAWAPTLMRDEVKAMENVRAHEASEVSAWLESAGEPEAVSIAAGDGAMLVGHIFEAQPNGNRWAVIAHGYRGAWQDGLMHARRFCQEGLNVLLVEMRAHGASEGDLCGLGLLEGDDLVAWLHWLSRRVGQDARIVVHGTGMGAAAALMVVAKDDLPSSVRACVADAPYTDAWNVAIPLLRPGAKMSAHPMVDLLRLACLLRKGGYDPARANALAAVGSSQVPTLLIATDQDTVCPSYMAARLADACAGAAAGERHELAVYEGAGHAQAALADPERYYAELGEFVGRWL